MTLFDQTVGGKIGWIAFALAILFIVLVIQNTEILSWLLVIFYGGPR